MPNIPLKLTYALKDGIITHISKVESGLACGCICPACGDKLIARKGTVARHHFAHYSKETCEYGIETALHLAAKEVIASAKEMVIPKVILSFPQGRRSAELIYKSMKIKIDRVELEKRFDNIIPDIAVYSGKQKFFVEIFVTHAIDEKKLKKIRDMDVSTIEIDLSKFNNLPDEIELMRIVLEDSPPKIWKYNRKEKQEWQRYIATSEKFWVKQRGLAMHVDNCPKKMRTWQGKIYANVIHDCFYCESLIFRDKDCNYIFCFGKQDELNHSQKSEHDL